MLHEIEGLRGGGKNRRARPIAAHTGGLRLTRDEERLRQFGHDLPDPGPTALQTRHRAGALR